MNEHEGGAASKPLPEAEDNPTPGTASTPARKEAMDVFVSKIDDRLASGWSKAEIVDMADKEIPGGASKVERRHIRETLADRSSVGRRRLEPIATPPEAEAAYLEFKSERKAAGALGISKTQLRRLLGKDS